MKRLELLLLLLIPHVLVQGQSQLSKKKRYQFPLMRHAGHPYRL